MIVSNSGLVELFALNEESYLFLEKVVSKRDWVLRKVEWKWT